MAVGGASQHRVGLAETRSLFRNRRLRRLWSAQFSALSVTYGLALAGAVLVGEQTASSAQVGLVILSAILPAFLASLVAGAVVDRWGRVPVIMVSHSARALVALGFWICTSQLSPDLAPGTIYATNLFLAVFAQFAMTAELSLLPDQVDQEHLLSANSITQLNILCAEGLGVVVLVPVVIRLAGVPAMGLLAAGLCALAVLLMAAIPRERHLACQATVSQPNFGVIWGDLRAGWRAIGQDHVLRLVTVQATVAAAVLLVLLTLTPSLATRFLGLGAEDAPLVALPAGIGFLLGALVLGRWDGSWSRPAWISAGLAALGFALLLLAALGDEGRPATTWLILVLVSALGFALALVIIPARTVLQERPPPPMRGRVIAAQLALSHAVAVFPLILGGALADRLGVQAVMGLLALPVFGAGAFGMHQIRSRSHLPAKG